MNNQIIGTAEILENLWLSDDSVMEMVLDAPHIAETAKPGQFVNLLVGDDKLRRPFTISDADAEVGVIAIRYRVQGEGTRLLSEMEPGREISCLGPLGNGFDLNIEHRDDVLIIAGGMGSAMVPFLSKEVEQEAEKVTVLLGGKTKKDVDFWDALIPYNDGGSIMTEDGSYGSRGLVTDRAREMLETHRKYQYKKIYTCGPVGMMEAVNALGQEFGIPVEVALESEMGCGYNVCKSCTCIGSDGKPLSVCHDGPVLDGAKVDWAYLRQKEELKKPAPVQIEVINESNRAVREKFDMDAFLSDNPYIIQSGLAGFGLEQDGIVDMSKFGGISLKGLTKDPRPGNPGTRIAEIQGGGIMNSIGLENPGIIKFLEKIDSKIARKYQDADTAILANIAAATPEEFEYMIEHLDYAKSINAYEINVSCPNLDKKIIGTDAALVFDVVQACRDATDRPIIVKLSPNVTNAGEMAIVAEAAGADAISLINTVVGYDLDPKTGRSVFYNGVAGMSDHPIVRNIAMAKMFEVVKVSGLPIIAGGGIKTAEDVVRYAMMGANAFALGASYMRDPQDLDIFKQDVSEFMKEYHDGKTLADITGAHYVNTMGDTIAGLRLKKIRENQK